MKNGKISFVDAHETLKGVFYCNVFRHVNGERVLIEVIEENNLIVNMARDQMARLIAGEFANRNITKIGFGTNNAKPAVEDTVLTDAYVKTLDGYEFPDMGQVRFNWSLGTSEANGKGIKEFGLFCEDGALFARRRREKVGGEPADPIHKEADISLEGTWTIIF
ncbi:MAG: hypothetical protein LBU82_04950 [Treponema sp.]|jgi:hypothetical protein|nr:hypothetical protein [Treponema sp.]